MPSKNPESASPPPKSSMAVRPWYSQAPLQSSEASQPTPLSPEHNQKWYASQNAQYIRHKTEAIHPDEQLTPEVAEMLEKIVHLDTSGHAEIPFTSDPLTGITEPSEIKTVSFEAIASQNQGWKLHLNFDAKDQVKTTAIHQLLQFLHGHGHISAFKIGHGGGKEFDQPGKEATIYVGHRDKATLVATILQAQLYTRLNAPEGSTLQDDIPFTDLVMGRFEIGQIDPSFSQYGATGHPLLKSDISNLLAKRSQASTASATEVEQLKSNATRRADQLLRQRFGIFYTGTSD